MAKSKGLTSPPLKRGRKREGARFTLIAAISLDGRITAGKREGSEWTSREDKEFFQQELSRADVVIMGRKTFDAIKRPLLPRNRVVFSSSPPLQRGRTRGGGSLYFLNSPTVPELKALLHKNNWTRVAIAGGTSIYDWFFRNGLIDELYLTLEPVVFGSGRPFLKRPQGSIKMFKLASVRKLSKQGTLLLHYIK